MADTQNAIYAQAYGRNIMQLAQQKQSKLLDTVYRKDNVTGKVYYQDQIGKWNMETKGGRNTETPNNDPVLGRRMGVMIDKHDNRMVDRGDELKTISDPRSAYTIAGSQSIGRQIDQSILDSVTGTANSGEAGATTAPTPTSILITAASPTVARIAVVKKNFDDNDVEMEDRYFVTNTTLLQGMMGVEQATSSDYHSIKSLVRGEIDSWMGFQWKFSTLLSTDNVAYAYQKYGICIAFADAPFVRTDERADKSYSWQLYYELNIGAVRLEEERVFQINEG